MAPSSSQTSGQKVDEWRTNLWNPRTQEFLGRTGGSWALVLLFYVVFYTFLTGVFSLTMWVMLQTMNEYTPKYQDRITNPAYNDSVQVSTNNRCRPGAYHLQEDSGDVRNTPKRSCQFNRTVLGRCSGLEDRTYGYSEGKPCILVKMNKIIKFLPGEAMTPYVSCSGKAGDANNVHELHYFPPNGTLDLMYFPYYGKKAHVNYTQPVVAVKFVNVTANIDIRVECKVYGTNVNNDDERDRFAGRVSFTLNVGSF
ncbi:sodium/potassium-transporting ATPase subunit beta-2-like isoform X2 [Narcine bancroftii]|uniref:sodium/potassium-transporting ATPase subunit beta-2-like isoform X2 n=1 Tax=Narcine bancroftii TaxID=1343680 RepID=UPI003831FFE6